VSEHLRSAEPLLIHPPVLDDGHEIKLSKGDLKRLTDPVRPLDGWERYRALTDAADEAYDLIDIRNREARFALIVMGALNALPVLLLTKTNIIHSMTKGERYWMLAFVTGYALLLLFFILQAIEALHPGRFRPSLTDWSKDSGDLPVGVRDFEDVIKLSAAEHWTAWQTVRLSQLNAELAVQVHSLALKNSAKHRAVGRLYVGLRAMALTLAALVAMYLLFVWT
jgi:hypothetical protein